MSVRPVSGLTLVVAVAVLATPAGGRSAPPQAQATAATSVHAGDPDAADLLRFVEQAREGTARYRDRGRAIAEAFRPLGPDAPAMGRHWIHAGRVLSGTFDPASPAGLTYILVDEKPELTGVFYVLPLEPGDRLPDTPGGLAAWHYHNGDLSDEALLSVHDPMHGSDAFGLRVAVMHAWIWAENPGGMLAPDNWTLPFVRLGLSPPETRPRAAMAVSLATEESRAFFVSRTERAAGRRIPGVDHVLRVHGDRIRDRLAGLNSTALSQADVEWMEAAWRDVMDDLLLVASPTDRAAVRDALDPSGP